MSGAQCWAAVELKSSRGEGNAAENYTARSAHFCFCRGVLFRLGSGWTDQPPALPLSAGQADVDQGGNVLEPTLVMPTRGTETLGSRFGRIWQAGAGFSCATLLGPLAN